MAYNGYNGYGDDGMDGVESSGPKVTVREVCPSLDSFGESTLMSLRSNKIVSTLSFNRVPSPWPIPCVAPSLPKSLPSRSI